MRSSPGRHGFVPVFISFDVKTIPGPQPPGPLSTWRLLACAAILFRLIFAYCGGSLWHHKICGTCGIPHV